MTVSYTHLRSDRNAGEKRELAADDGNDLTGGVLHIVRDELAVCARIGQELFFVERLNEIERLLGGEAVVSVCLALQGGQITTASDNSLKSSANNLKEGR